MNFPEILQQIQSELQEIADKEAANQKEQVELTQSIEQLTQDIELLQQEIEQKYLRQSEIDREALDLCRRGEELKEKQEKIAKIQSFSEEFQGLQAEFKGNQDLLDTLYSSISAIAKTTNSDLDSYLTSVQKKETSDNQILDLEISIPIIKEKLPHGEKLYQKLVAEHLDEYHTFQNQIIDGLDLIWCSVAFVAFGKESYKQMCLKHHPDRDGSRKAMQLVNTAWEIAQEHLKSGETIL